MKKETIVCIQGCLFKVVPIEAPTADKIANANGFQFAEQFCKEKDGKYMWLYPNGKISTEVTIQPYK